MGHVTYPSKIYTCYFKNTRMERAGKKVELSSLRSASLSYEFWKQFKSQRMKKVAGGQAQIETIELIL